MNKKVLAILTLLLVLLVACSPADEQKAEAVEEKEEMTKESAMEEKEESMEAKEVTIGFIAPLVGDTALYGEASQTGVELALDGIDAPIKVIYENGGCNAKDATTAANKLIDIDNVKVIIGTVCSSETLAIAPIAEEHNVVLLSAASSSPDITDAGDYVFRTWPSDKLQGPVIAQYMVDQGHQKVAVIHTNSDYNLGLANAFTASFEEKGGEVTITETYDQDVRDFRTLLTKVKAKNPDAIYIVPYAEGGLLVKQANQLGLEQPFFASETIGNQDFLDNAGGTAEGIVYATPSFNEDADMTSTFLAAYQEKFGKESPWEVITANSYDGMNIIAAAIAEKGYDADGIKEYLYGVKDYDGVAGKLTIDENGDALKGFQLMKIEGGEFVALE